MITYNVDPYQSAKVAATKQTLALLPRAHAPYSAFGVRMVCAHQVEKKGLEWFLLTPFPGLLHYLISHPWRS